MRFVSTRTHAIMDYIGGLLLLFVPMYWIDTIVPRSALYTPMVVGIVMLAMAVVTDYEISVTNLIPMSGHLAMDAVAGLILAASPWLFGFYESVWIPHVVLGALELGAALTTKLQRTFPGGRPTGRRAAA